MPSLFKGQLPVSAHRKLGRTVIEHLDVKSIQSIQPDQRPRERLYKFGPASLLDEELLAIVLGSGSSKVGVHKLATKVLRVLDESRDKLTINDLVEIEGMGIAKAAKIIASIELSRRKLKPASNKIKSAADVYAAIKHYASRKQEHFLCLSLNGANEVIANRVVTIGLVNSTQIHPREVFSDPIVDRAASVIVAHNHPSGNLEPSDADKQITRILSDAGKLLGIKLLDHVIFGEEAYLSFQEAGLL